MVKTGLALFDRSCFVDAITPAGKQITTPAGLPGR